MYNSNGQKITVFSKTELFNSKVLPELEKICDFCLMNDIPMFFTACVENNKKGSTYIRREVSPDTRNIVLQDDQFNKHICIACGFDVINRADSIEVANNDDFDFQEHYYSDDDIKNIGE